MTQRNWVCLVYHDVLPHEPPRDGSPEYFGVSHRAFLQQIDSIADAGLRACSLREAIGLGGQGCVALTFDDGNAGQFERAFPALVERGMTATFFVVTSWVGQLGYVTWDQLREMRAEGMDIQSHTRTHAYFSELSPAEARDELVRSKAELDEALGQDTDQIALPGGFEPSRTRWSLLSESGFRTVATSRWGVNTGLVVGRGGCQRVRRCWAQGEPSVERFTRIVRGDRRMAARQWARRVGLEPLKSMLGASRYLRWRERFLDALGKTGGNGR